MFWNVGQNVATESGVHERAADTVQQIALLLPFVHRQFLVCKLLEQLAEARVVARYVVPVVLFVTVLVYQLIVSE